MPTTIEVFEADVRKLQKLVPEKATAVYRDLAFHVVEAAVYGNPRYGCPGTPVDKGFARGSWIVTLGTPAKSGPRHPDQDRPVALNTALIYTATLNDPIMVASHCVYMNRLEYEGHSQQAPRGFVRLAMRAGKHILRDLLATRSINTRRK